MTLERFPSDPNEAVAMHVEGQWPMRDIEEALRGLRFGTVTIIVQDGVVIQVDRTEKRRIRRGGPQR